MSLPTSTISTTNLDAGTDTPLNARPQLLLAIQHLNDIIENIDAYSTNQGNSIANNLLSLDGSGKIATTKLIDRVTSGNLEDGSVEKDNFYDANSSDKGITNNLIANNTIPTSKLNFTSSSLTTSNNVVPTQTAVVNFLNSYNASPTVITFSRNGTTFHNANTNRTQNYYFTSVSCTKSPTSNYATVSGNTATILKGGWYVIELSGTIQHRNYWGEDDEEDWSTHRLFVSHPDYNLPQSPAIYNYTNYIFMYREHDVSPSTTYTSPSPNDLKYIYPNTTVHMNFSTTHDDFDADLTNLQATFTLYDHT